MKDKTKAILVGIFIIVAYLVLAESIFESKALVMLLEMISGLAVIGIAVIFFPYFNKYKKLSY